MYPGFTPVGEMPGRAEGYPHGTVSMRIVHDEVLKHVVGMPFDAAP
jgi:hypothetical protein